MYPDKSGKNRSLENSHQVLKELVASRLADRGFSVKVEKRIYCPEDIAPPNYVDSRYKQSYFSVDVYGERNGEIVMYEIGHCEYIKLEWLRKYVGKVIHIPFLTKWIPDFYRKPEKKYILTEEERWFITRRLSNRLW